MGETVEVPTQTAPINPSVLLWAIDEAGESIPGLADRLKVPTERVESWVAGDARPSVSQLRRLAKILKRPSALFYLAEPPARAALPTRLRHAPGGRDLTPTEIGEIRWARRLQEAASWLIDHNPDEQSEPLPSAQMDVSPEAAAAVVRDFVGVPVDEQLAWEDPGTAYREWRRALTDKGILVFQFELGRGGLRGFSTFDTRAPMLAVNSAYRPEVRIYSMMHELGHLVLGEESACVSFVNPQTPTAPAVERWCERFAAAFLLPAEAFKSMAGALGLGVDTDERNAFSLISRIARRFKVSLRAAAIRAGETGVRPRLFGVVEQLAGPTLDLPPEPTKKGGGGVPAAEKRVRFFGRRLPDLFINGVDQGLITQREAGGYLHLAPAGFTDLEHMIRSGSDKVAR